MELKTYQKKVIADLTRYLELLNETKSDTAAFRLFWQEKSAPTLGLYQNVIPAVQCDILLTAPLFSLILVHCDDSLLTCSRGALGRQP